MKISEKLWHIQSSQEVAASFGVDLSQGLGAEQHRQALAQHGPNRLATQKAPSAWWLLLGQFRSLIVGLLVLAAAVALATGDRVEALAILVVILLNALIGFGTEWRAARALEGLRQQAIQVARVLREGSEAEVSAEDLVPGDVVLLAAGDRVPADGRLVEAAQLKVDESALTGESLPVEKHSEPLEDPKAALGDRHNMVHLGSGVSDGRGRFVVTATGAQSEVGQIGQLMAQVAEHGTPLEAKLAELSRALLGVVLALCVVIVLVGWLRGIAFLPMVEVGISLAIAAVPEGLLAVTTMTLALGMQRMARMKALVRRLPAVESLGSTTVICTDKTGTLTRNEMTVKAYHLPGLEVAISGSGYSPEGDFKAGDRLLDPKASVDAEGRLRLALMLGALCNDAKLEGWGGDLQVLGDPTEAALLVAAQKGGLDLTSLRAEFPRSAELPFNSDTKLMATAHHGPSGASLSLVKGAPGSVLEASTQCLTPEGVRAMDEGLKASCLAANEALAGQAMRVLALAYRELPAEHGPEALGQGLTYVGLVGMSDPPREEAKATIERCHQAGIRTVMITGDQEATAAEIAKQLGLDVDAQGQNLRTVHARELEGLDESDWQKLVADTAVYARVSPEHKLRIVEALQKLGHVVAMTGDGVNDAPALRQADVGIAMGIRGTEVAKDAADVVITDDNFATIVAAVEQGRIVVDNILRFIHYLFSCNLAEIVVVFVAVMVGWPLPLGVLQILWLNLVTDIFPATALALEPSAPDAMTKAPRAPDAPLITPAFAWLIAWQGLVLGACTLASFAVGLHWYGQEGEPLRHAVTLAFMTLALAQTFHAFNARSKHRSAFGPGFFSNRWLWGATLVCVLLQVGAVSLPWMRQVLHTVPLSAQDWGVVLVASLLPVVVVEGVKAIQAWMGPAKEALPAPGPTA